VFIFFHLNLFSHFRPYDRRPHVHVETRL